MSTAYSHAYTFQGKVEKFPGRGGWYFVVVPKKYTKELCEKRAAWGKYPIAAQVANTTWKTKLMLKKGGDFFVALRADIRKKEGIVVGNRLRVSFTIT